MGTTLNYNSDNKFCYIIPSEELSKLTCEEKLWFFQIIVKLLGTKEQSEGQKIMWEAD